MALLERCVGALVTLAFISACGVPSSPARPPVRPSALTVSGTVTVKGAYPAVVTEDELTCITGGGYTDIRQGAQVVVTDASSTTIALGRLGYGSWSRGNGCVFLFEIADVPAGHQFYGVEVTHRGRLQFTGAQVAEPLALTIGR